ncbi:hypothetical protein [Rhodanobacter denitrificans]|uniref:Uncharacterized protein n=1 Tax=Rhodanobacter denitrificans TaxID=666685 RepID=M4NFF1_9GAMM|nr:hypothetical protein [Rhodanobacter denitrificans]AGG88767.1 hypothetical protein R2APBS1_1632 [Rhodanobacter denitrificans]UJJ58566.1 hypothetical protein LRK55_00050 [Rhodanobacter denitrificans]UJM87899.1 hypothetical protein LRJ86_06235 [Rhodanobacter denitrificans]
MTFASKARFSGIIVADIAKWLAGPIDDDAKRDIFELIEAAKRDPSQFRALRVKWAFYRLRGIVPAIIEREPASDLRDDLSDAWAFLSAEVRKASPDWSEADRHLDTFHAHMKHAVHFDDQRAVIETGTRVRKPFEEANAASSAAAAARYAQWQARATDLWALPQHAHKSAIEIARLIARGTVYKPGTIRTRISKPAP